jgi:hypothetical protein
VQLIGWVDRELDNFTPWYEEGVTRPSSLQRFAELAIAYDTLDESALSVPSLEARWNPFINSHLTDPAFGELARSRLDWAWALLLPYLVMRKRGLLNDYHDTTLLHSHRAGFPEALEVVPYRALDYAHFAQASGFEALAANTSDALLSRTFAAKASCRYLVNDESAYALTHSIFYASSFGKNPVPADRLPNAAAIVDSMIIDCCLRKQYDLLGELLTCSVVLQRCKLTIRELGLSVFLTSLDQTGCLLPNDQMDGRSFQNCYHTTLVGLILCASLANLRS